MDTHGYVYAFAHQPNGWIKVGMTEKNDEQRCWDRIHYIKQHRLPDEGWEFVGFVATYKTRALETRIRRNLKTFRVMLEGKRTELFKCSVAMYLVTLNALNEFIYESQSRQDSAAPRETEEQPSASGPTAEEADLLAPTVLADYAPWVVPLTVRPNGDDATDTADD